MTLSLSPLALSQGSFQSVLEIDDLDGSVGFVINGIVLGDRVGSEVSRAGDVNGDGINDLIVGGRFDNNSYVVFGAQGLGSGASLEVSDLDGSNGFVISNAEYFSSISNAGDINGDGLDDLILGTFFDTSYVVFGSGDIGSGGAIDLADLDASNGLEITGFDTGFPGLNVSRAGDVNGDGIDDLLIGSPEESPNGYSSGASFVVFGGGTIGSGGAVDVSNLDGSNGFVINGIDRFDDAGFSVSEAGDINGDGIDDIIIGTPEADPDNTDSIGQSYVVFGGTSVGMAGVVELAELDGSNGFVINGVEEGDRSGFSVSGAGDINGDGFDDLAIGAPDAINGDYFVGEIYVVFGDDDIGSSGAVGASDLDGSNGFIINGIDGFDYAGLDVSDAGDINGDGFSDLLIGSYGNGNGFASGQAYVVFGSASAGNSGTFELSELDGTNGFTFNGVESEDRAGRSVSGLGDINDDGVDDLIIGAFTNADRPGQSYVILGQTDAAVASCNGLTVTVDLSLGQTPGPEDDVILGTEGDDRIIGSAGNDTICGLAGDDFIRGGTGNDWIDGGDGKDDIRGGSGSDQISGGNKADFIRGDRGQDTINGGTGADVISGGKGADVINGDGGKDTLFGGLGNDLINGGNDNDTISGGDGQDTLNGNDGNDDIVGDSGADVLNGGAGNDILRGWSGNDQLNGDAGDDTLSGGGGTDVCTGGEGNDLTGSSCETVIN